MGIKTRSPTYCCDRQGNGVLFEKWNSSLMKARGKEVSRKIAKQGRRAIGKSSSATDFDEVVALIDGARVRAVASANNVLIDLYWSIGEHVAKKVASQGWGKGTVEELAEYIQRRQLNARGFSARNIWRMMQFFETYRDLPKLAPLVRELSWTHNLLIMSRSKRDEEREFYLRLCLRE